MKRIKLIFFGILFFALVMPAHAADKLERKMMFPSHEKYSPVQALQYYQNLTQKHTSSDSYIENSHHHWMVYESPIYKKTTDKIIEVPDFQINYLEIYAFKNGSKVPELVLRYGDEFAITKWTHRNRTGHALFTFEAGQAYTFVVYYSRPGNRPQILIKLYDPETYLAHWKSLELKFGFIYGLLVVYWILIFLLWLFSQEIAYFFLCLYVLSYLLYYFISTGHLKYYFGVDLEGVYSTMRPFLTLSGLYALNSYSLIHYNAQRKLRFVFYIWNFLMALALALAIYGFATGINLYGGLEKEIILILRLLVFLLIAVQIYLPVNHYRKFKKITYFTYLVIFSILNFVVYIYQTSVLVEVDFNSYIFYTIWLLIFEIVVLAVGISSFSLNEKKQRIRINIAKNQLQKEARNLQFESQEKEKKRIASELHDDVLNRLSVALLLFRDTYITRSEFVKTLKQLSSDIQYYTLGIYPVWVEQKKIEELVAENVLPMLISNNAHLVFESIPQEMKLSKMSKLQVYRLIQEFVKNAIIHGKATEIKVRLEQKDASLYLCLIDNGIGYETDEKLNGLGLQSAQNRIQVLGGKMQIQSAPNKGVRWDLSFPLR